MVFRKLQFQNDFSPRLDAELAFLNFSGLKSVFDKLRLCDGLVWTVGLTVETNLRFQVTPVKCEQDLK